MKKNNQLNTTLILLLFLFLGLACNGLCGVSPQQQQQQQTTPAPTAAVVAQTPTPDAESARLKEKIAELEKKVESQQKPVVQQQPPPTIIVRPNVPVIRGMGGSGTAWVNSPGDGFLALRSYPSAELGYRVLKIPHGATVRVLGCQGYSERVGGRAGRWCQVSYAGYTGWAFDGWLVY